MEQERYPQSGRKMEQSSAEKRRLVASGIWIFLAALTIWAVRTCRASEEGATIEQGERSAVTDTLQVGVDLTPVDFGIDSEGHISGRQVEWVRQIFGEKPIEWHPFADRREALEALRVGAIDLYSASIPIATAKAYSGLRPTEWLYQMEYALVYPFTTPQSWAELQAQNEEGIEVAYAKSDPMAGLILEHIQELSYPALQIVPREESPEECLLLLKRGELQYLLCNDALAHALTERDSTLVALRDVTLKMPQVWLTRAEDSLLLQAINTAILRERSRERE